MIYHQVVFDTNSPYIGLKSAANMCVERGRVASVAKFQASFGNDAGDARRASPDTVMAPFCDDRTFHLQHVQRYAEGDKLDHLESTDNAADVAQQVASDARGHWLCE